MGLLKSIIDTINERLPTKNVDKQLQDFVYPNNAPTKSLQNIDNEIYECSTLGW